MTLHFIGLGLCDEKDITLRGLETIKACDAIYLERYTSKLHGDYIKLAQLYGKVVIVADRKMVEEDAETTILADAEKKEVAFLVIGDPLAATTHMDLYLRARERGIHTQVIHNASIMTAIGATGLQLYKFGKTSSIPYPQENFLPHTPYDTIKANKSIGAHTLLLLDVRPQENRYMSVKEAIDVLLRIEKERKESVFTEKTLCVGCARLGSPDAKMNAGCAQEVMRADLGGPLHCLVVPGDLHFAEEDALKLIA